MGIYARTTIRVGLWRFTASGAGISVSVGLPRLRVGAGPRGNFVRIGSGGARYLTSPSVVPRQPAVPSRPGVRVAPGSRSHVPLTDASGLTALELRSTGGDDLMRQLNASGGVRWGWVATIAALVIGAALWPWGVIIWVLATPVCVLLFLRDAARRAVVVFYEVDDREERWFEQLVQDWQAVSGSSRVWRTVAAGRVQNTYQHKTNAGVQTIVQRARAATTLGGPARLRTNVVVPTVTVGKESLSFLPDRVVVRSGRTYADVSYRHLRATGSVTRFVERAGGVPADTRQVDRTWQYVNVKGGPDRRFKNNPVLPVVLYGQIELTTAQGLFWQLQTSRTSGLDALTSSVRAAPSM